MAVCKRPGRGPAVVADADFGYFPALFLTGRVDFKIPGFAADSAVQDDPAGRFGVAEPERVRAPGHAYSGTRHRRRHRSERRGIGQSGEDDFIVELQQRQPLIEQFLFAFDIRVCGIAERLSGPGEAFAGFALELGRHQFLGGFDRGAEDGPVLFQRAPVLVERHEIVEHRFGGGSVCDFAPVFQEFAHVRLRFPQQPGVKVEREAVFDRERLNVGTAFRRQRNFGDHGGVVQADACFDRVVDHAEEGQGQGLPDGEDVEFITVIPHRDAGFLPLLEFVHHVAVPFAVVGEGMEVAAGIGGVFDELAVADRIRRDVDVTLVGDGGEFQVRETFFQPVGQAVVKVEPRGRGPFGGAFRALAVVQVVGREGAQDFQFRLLFDRIAELFENDVVHFRFAVTGLGFVMFALDFGKILGVGAEQFRGQRHVVAGNHEMEAQLVVLRVPVAENIDEVARHPDAEVLHVAPVAAEVEPAVFDFGFVLIIQSRELPCRFFRHEFAGISGPQPAHAEFPLQERINRVQGGGGTAAGQVQGVGVGFQ